MKRIIHLMFLTFAAIPVFAQLTDTQNFIISRTYKQAGANPDDVAKVTTDIEYVDGLGRTLQQVSVGQSIDGKDIVRPFKYNAQGRQSMNFLPYAANGTGKYHTSGINDQASFYTSNDASLGLDPSDLSRPYSETIYEQSSLNRPVSLVAPGGKSSNATIEYKTNGGSDVKRYDFNGSISQNGTYSAGMLVCRESRDEEQKTSREYFDMAGRLICKMVVASATQTLATYYVYDDLGMLRAVLQPQFQDEASTSNFAFLFSYDGRGRIVSKSIPGAGTVRYVYDKYDRIALSQDENQLARGYWGFIKYDRQNRAVMTGEVQSTNSQSGWQGLLDASSAHHESANTTGIGYVFPNVTEPLGITEDQVLAVNYYDSYSFPKAANLAYRVSSAFYPSYNSNVVGHPTGRRVRVLPSSGLLGGWLSNVTYYDNEYRPIQTIRELADLGPGSIECISIEYKYDIAPVVQNKRTEQILAGVISSSHEVNYSYDHADRMLFAKEKVTIGTKTKEAYTVAQRYNALGYLQSKWLHSIDNLKFRKKTSYTNNIRGWLTAANTVYRQYEISPETPEFSVGLIYANGSNYSNGNISGMRWARRNLTQVGADFTYDGADRLTGSVNPVNNTNLESDISYDKNGNITKLKRSGSVVDDLTYQYIGWGNRLRYLDDNSGNDSGVKNGTTSYQYDGNGNLISDDQKQTALTYNYLNLPRTITIAGTTQGYDYDASGTKLKYAISGSEIFRYAGVAQYKEVSNINRLYRMALEEGQMVTNGDTIKYNYYLKDHLGNVRVVFNEVGDAIQASDYYPFGLSIDRSNPVQNQNVRSGVNRYLYNGKELQIATGYLDYGARMYMPEIGRWGAVDPLAEQFPSWSPYNYGKNNPIRFKDVDGLAPFDITLLGANNSSVTVKTDLVDLTVNASSLGVDFGGNYTLSGNDVLQAAVDIGGVFDPTPTLDVVGAGLSANSGDYWGAGASVLGAALPYVGDLAKTGKIAKGVDKISDAIDAAKGSEKTMETSRAARREAMRDAGIPTSQQPSSQSKNASGREYSYEVPKNGGRKQTKSVQQQTMDRSHQGQKHWEAGGVKTDEGKTRMNNYGRPKLDSDKAKVNY